MPDPNGRRARRIAREDALILCVVKTLRGIVRVLPLGVSMTLASALGAFAYAISPRRRQVAQQNLRAAFGGAYSQSQLRRIAKGSIQNLARTVVEMLRFPETDLAYADKYIDIHGAEKVYGLVAKGEGAIFLTGHFGNWELLNVISNLKGIPLVALARSQKHPRSDEYLNYLRTCRGGQVIRKGMPVREILRALKQGKSVGILSDQDGGRRGTFVRLFGRLSSSPSGVATFALRTGAPIMPLFIFRTDGPRHRIEAGEPLMVPAAGASPEEAERFILQQFADVLERQIRRCPDQWLWGHRRWKSTPDRSVLILSDGKSGHLNQSQAFAEAMRQERFAQDVPETCFKKKIIEVRYRTPVARECLRWAARLLRGHLPFGEKWMRWALEPLCYKELMDTYADVVVSCGSTLVPVNLIMKKINASRSAVLMRPGVPFKRFDAVVLPRHDGTNASENVFVTERVPSLGGQARLAAEADRLKRELGLDATTPRVGLLVGGDTDSVKFRQGEFRRALDGLTHFMRQNGTQILATSSRRTPRWADEMLKSSLADRERCPLLVIANEANRAGVVDGILGLSDVVVVSAESMSMLSEAMDCGKPVIAFLPAPERGLKKKYRAFLGRMASLSAIRMASPADLVPILSETLDGRAQEPQARVPIDDAKILRDAARKVLQ